jgi:pimeloyl-ACP methyl ester carboxylesterase
MVSPTIHGVAGAMVATPRITTRVLTSGSETGEPALFLHGNLSSATWWEETMAALPPGFRGIAPDMRGFGDADPAAKVDAGRGLGDFVEDAAALLDRLGLEEVHVIGMSLGGSVIWQMMIDIPERLLSVTMAAPGSPYGMGGVRGPDGIPCARDFAGSGGGLISTRMVQLLRAGDRDTVHQLSPRLALRNYVFRPPFVPRSEEDLLSAMLATHFGEQDFPGDAAVSSAWPFVSPGVWGATNALSPKYACDISRLFASGAKPDVLWIRGEDDIAVSDASAADPGRLGQLGLLRGWPGLEVFPPQPILLQTRTVLDRYAASGGYYHEVVIPECGHAPFIEKPVEANRILHKHLARK